MTAAEARAAVKRRVDIDSDVTDWDTHIDDFVDTAVGRFYPDAMQDAGVTTASVTVDQYGQAIMALPGGFDGYRQIETSTGNPINQTYQYGNNVRLRDLNSDVTQVVVYGLKKYTLATIPPELKLALYWFAISDFYTFLVGSKRQYNSFMQNGRPEVDNMEELADAYELKAKVLLTEKGVTYGR